jgi:hypothetical protein
MNALTALLKQQIRKKFILTPAHVLIYRKKKKENALKGGTHDQTCLSYMYARTCLSNMNVRVVARKRFKHVHAYKKSVKLLNLALPENKSVR